MEWWQFMVWGLFGSFAVSGLDLWRAIGYNGGHIPPHFKTLGHLAGELIRFTVGAGLAVAFGESGQINGELGALIVGAAAPTILEKLIAQFKAEATKPPPPKPTGISHGDE